MQTRRRLADPRVDLGLGMGLVMAAPQLNRGLPMMNGKLRLLGQMTPRLGLGLDLDLSSLLIVNHASLNLVGAYDLFRDPDFSLRPYVSMGAGVVQVYEQQLEQNFVAPALSARGGLEFKPVPWLGLGLESGAIGGLDNGKLVLVPFAGALVSLYLI